MQNLTAKSKKPEILCFKHRHFLTRGGKPRLRVLTPFIVAVSLLPFTLQSAQSSLPAAPVSQNIQDDNQASARLSLREQLALISPISKNIHSAINGSDENDTSTAQDHDGELAEAQAPKPQPKTLSLKINKGDTLAGLLQKNGVSGRDAYNIVNAIGVHYDPRKMRPGQKLNLTLNPDENSGEYSFAALDMKIDALKDIHVVRDGDDINADLNEMQTKHVQRAHKATIQTSIYGSAAQAGIPAQVIAEMIRIYSWNVDFQRDIRRGDMIEVLYDAEQAENGKIVDYGNVLYAKLSVGGKDLPMYRFESTDGTVDYYDPEGMSIRKTLMKTPVDGARLSSGFGMRRHPVLGYNKMHKGMDFAAPTGTPIYAAGDGVIERIGRNGGYGNYIKIRHNGKLHTAYAHMQKFKSGLGKGSRVKQGQVIGYIGTTGRSTGPHLHYEVLKNGAQVNPRSVDLPTGNQLAGADLKKFKSIVKDADNRYAAKVGDVKMAQAQ